MAKEAALANVGVVSPPVHPATVAAEADYVIYVGDVVDGLGFVEALQGLGAEAVLYPLDAWKAPTLFSILGLVGVIKDKLAKGEKVVLVGDERTSLILAALRIISDGHAAGLASVTDLTSPLHYRLLVALELLRKNGIDIEAEASRYQEHAFTGGDASRSDYVLLAVDLERQLHKPGLAARAYRGAALGSPYQDILEALDPRGEGAVEVIALRVEGGLLDAYLGCRFLLHPLGCRPETERVRQALARLAPSLGARLGIVEELSPEEAACLVYSEYPCR